MCVPLIESFATGRSSTARRPSLNASLARRSRGARSPRFVLAELHETRVASQCIKHWVEPQDGRSERNIRRESTFVRYSEQLGQSGDGTIRFAHARGYSSKEFNRNPSLEPVFLDGHHGLGPLNEFERSLLVTEAHAGESQISEESVVVWLFV